MDVHEVTVGQFQKFTSETGYRYDLWDNVARYSPEYGSSKLERWFCL